MREGRWFPAVFKLILCTPAWSQTTQPADMEDPTTGDPQASVITFGISSPPGAVSRAIVVVPRLYLQKPIQPAAAAALQASELRYPVIYLLGGFGTDYRRWYAQAKAAGQPLGYWADRYNAILACLDGKGSSWYLNAAADVPDSAAWQWEDVMIRDAIPAVDKRYRTWADPAGRGVTGMGMGGHGAVFLTARHPAVFGACSSMSGVMDLRHSLHKDELAKRLGPLDRNEQRWVEHSAMVQADKLAGRPVGVMIDCGVNDPFIEDNRLMHEHLLNVGIPHDYAERAGGHDWSYWINAMPYHLRFIADRLRPPGVPQKLAGGPLFRPALVDQGLPEEPQDLDVADMNRDGRPDIVVARPSAIVWYENPNWQRRVVASVPARSRVSAAAYDADGDGLPDLAMAAGWLPDDTRRDGSAWILRNMPGDRPWPGNQIAQQPTIRRVRWGDVDGDGKCELIVAPQKGIRTTPPAYAERGVRIMSFHVPRQGPFSEHWVRETINRSLHLVNDILPVQFQPNGPQAVLAASSEGITLFGRLPGGAWENYRLCAGKQDGAGTSSLGANRGSGYVAFGRLANGRRIIAALEPLDGREVAVYAEPDNWQQLWPRLVIDDTFTQGGGIACADLNGDGTDEIVAGYAGGGIEPRGLPTAGPIRRREPGPAIRGTPTGEVTGAPPASLKIYVAADALGGRWTGQFIDQGGMGVAGVKIADMNGDGRLDVVAIGSSTRNVKVYVNQVQ